MISTYKPIAEGGGYHEALASKSAGSAFEDPHGDFCFLDASSQVPNLNPSEIFRAIWAAVRYPHLKVATDITLSGTVGEYAHFWGEWNPVESHIAIWNDAYSPHVRPLSMLAFAPMCAVTFADGDIVSRRKEAMIHIANLLDGARGFDASGISDRIQVNELFGIAESHRMMLREFAAAIPQGKALGTWTCPCCANRRSLRMVDRKFVITNERGAPCEGYCWGHQRILRRLGEDMSLSTLIRMTGIELSVNFAIQACRIAEGPDVRVLIRDYSDPRGNIRRMFDDGRALSLSTRHYLKRSDHMGDLNMAGLVEMCTKYPDKAIKCMQDHPLVSEGYCLTVYG